MTPSIARRSPRLLPVLALAGLAPLMAEFVLGDQYLSGTLDAGMQIGEFVLFVLWYGTAAVLIREIARRTGRGWPTILLLALAFALVEEGLLTQSLFNRHYLGLDLISYGYVGWLGTGLPWAVFVLTIHVVWSIATPIALIEAIFGDPAPRLGRIGLAVVAVLMLLGGAATFAVSWWSDAAHFMAHPAQLVGAGLLAAIVVTVGLLLRPTRPLPQHSPWWPAALLAVALGTAFELLRWLLPAHVSAAVTTAVLLVLIAATVALAVGFRLDVTGLAVGAAATYAWVGMRAAASLGTGAVLEQAVIVLVVAVVVVVALRRRSRAGNAVGATGEAQNNRSSASSIPRSAS